MSSIAVSPRGPASSIRKSTSDVERKVPRGMDPISFALTPSSPSFLSAASARGEAIARRLNARRRRIIDSGESGATPGMSAIPARPAGRSSPRTLADGPIREGSRLSIFRFCSLMNCCDEKQALKRDYIVTGDLHGPALFGRRNRGLRWLEAPEATAWDIDPVRKMIFCARSGSALAPHNPQQVRRRDEPDQSVNLCKSA